jgi:hypothetical protein
VSFSFSLSLSLSGGGRGAFLLNVSTVVYVEYDSFVDLVIVAKLIDIDFVVVVMNSSSESVVEVVYHTLDHGFPLW